MSAHADAQAAPAAAGGGAARRPERRQYWLRGSVSAGSLLMLVAAVAMLSRESRDAGGLPLRGELEQTALAGGGTQQLAELTFYEKFMQRCCRTSGSRSAIGYATVSLRINLRFGIFAAAVAGGKPICL